MSENINVNLHDIFSTKIQNFVKENKENIKKYFESQGQFRKMNDENPSLLEDKQIQYIRHPTPENNFYLEIYNIAAVFRFDNGFFQLINNLNTILSIFNNKFKDKTETEKKQNLVSLFESIEEQDSQKIDEIIEFNFDEDQLYDIKLGLDKLVKYFGLETIQIYYESKLNIKNVGIVSLSGIVTGVAIGMLSASAICGVVGLGVGVIFGIVSLIFIKWQKQPKEIKENGIDENKINQNIDKIEKLFTDIKFFYTHNYYKNANVIIIAIDKSKDNYNDFIMYGNNLKYLNATDCPKKATPGTNRKYYDICFELMNKFVKKYEDLFKEKEYDILKKEVKKDFEALKGKMKIEDLENYLEQLKSKDKEPLKNAVTQQKELEKKKNRINNFDYYYLYY